MGYWALIFLACAVLAALFGSETITNSVSGISWGFTAFFLALAGMTAWYQARRGEAMDD